MAEPTTVEVEARSYELDPYGHLNNAVIVNWLEHGRSAYLRERGLSWMTLPEEYGLRVVVVRQDISYKAEVHLDDRLTIESRVARFGNTSFVFAQEIRFGDGRAAASAEITMVSVDDDGRPVRVPDPLRDRLG
jgi:acyl-CoA thioester hydrolase